MNIVRVLACEEVRDMAGAFVLDALESDEADAVRAHLAGCGDPHAEIADLAAAIPGLWETTPSVEPPVTLKSRILAAAAADLRAAPELGATPERSSTRDRLAPPALRATPGLAAVPRAGPANVRPLLRPMRPGMTLGWAAGIAAVLAIALLGAWNVVLQGQVGAQRTEQEALAAVVRAGATPGSLVAVLTAPEASGPYGPIGLAALTPNGSLTLAMHDLRPTSGAQVYQAWVIVGKAAPAPTGFFRVGDSGLGEIAAAPAPVAPGAVVAITLEPGPGATAPTLPILAAGTAPAPAT